MNSLVSLNINKYKLPIKISRIDSLSEIEDISKLGLCCLSYVPFYSKDTIATLESISGLEFTIIDNYRTNKSFSDNTIIVDVVKRLGRVFYDPSQEILDKYFNGSKSFLFEKYIPNNTFLIENLSDDVLSAFSINKETLLSEFDYILENYPEKIGVDLTQIPASMLEQLTSHIYSLDHIFSRLLSLNVGTGTYLVSTTTGNVEPGPQSNYVPYKYGTQDLDLRNFSMIAQQFISVITDDPAFVISNNIMVPNLNANYLQGYTYADITSAFVAKAGDYINDHLDVYGTFKIHNKTAYGTPSDHFNSFISASGQTVDISYTLPTSLVTNGYLKVDGSGNLSWAALSPGGNNTDVQYNNNGAFGGTDYFTYASDTLTLSAASGSGKLSIKNGSYYSLFQATTQSGNLTYTFPASITTNGYLKVAADGTLSWSSVSPGGNNTDVQYNNNGAFGGTDYFTYSSDTLTLGASSGSGKLALKNGNYTSTFQIGTQSGNLTYTWPTSITENNFLKVAADGSLSWAAGGATPGGADKEIQFNDGGSTLGGATNITFDKATGKLTFYNGGATEVASVNLSGQIVAGAHESSGTTEQAVNVIYGTSSAPVGTYKEGTLYIQYTP